VLAQGVRFLLGLAQAFAQGVSLLLGLAGGVQPLLGVAQAVLGAFDVLAHAASLGLQRGQDALQVRVYRALAQLLLQGFEVAFFDACDGALGDARGCAIHGQRHAPELLPASARRLARQRLAVMLQHKLGASARLVDGVELADAHALAPQRQVQLQCPAVRVSPVDALAHSLRGGGRQRIQGVQQRGKHRAFARLVRADDAGQPRVELEHCALAEPPVALQRKRDKAHHSRPPRSRYRLSCAASRYRAASCGRRDLYSCASCVSRLSNGVRGVSSPVW
jgi:hypothetical protein